MSQTHKHYRQLQWKQVNDIADLFVYWLLETLDSRYVSGYGGLFVFIGMPVNAFGGFREFNVKCRSFGSFGNLTENAKRSFGSFRRITENAERSFGRFRRITENAEGSFGSFRKINGKCKMRSHYCLI